MDLLSSLLNLISCKNTKLNFSNAAIYSEERINKDHVGQEAIDRGRYRGKF